MKRKLALFLTFALLTTSLLSACGGSGASTQTASNPGGAASSASGGDASKDPAVTFKVNNTHSGEGVQDTTMDLLIKLCDQYSGGTIKGTKIAGGSLGGEREMTEMVQLGTLDVGLIADMGIDSSIGGLGWAWLPFMITSYDQVDKYYINGWIGQELTKEMAAKGIVRVAATENEFRECGTVSRPIQSMDDFKGLKIRVPEVDACQDFYKACGAIPAAISTSETLAALEQKTVDGVDNSVYNLKSMGVLDDIKYVTMLNYMYSGASIVCSQSFWDKMTPAQQAAFTKAATEAGASFRKSMRADTQTIIKNGKFKTYEVKEDSQFYKDLKKVAVNLWSTYNNKFDSSIMEKINKDFGV
ncbi:Bacterial extracellular solute-binding protein, family 7 [Caprobacter fermentans]|uniref:Bacterial extracellular solute-binding protein, family 7 n=1 Tax=Caproicibacter fermentans TaxID=2576756 RepID=A0A6N8HWB2_9FIRM|nr:TRAP transporter substrate-binding protein [Caproicibacter fermentans]MVB10091.1 Bacterial extracellular solute-binding protein, family 7 [Caproicibacter fermentans]OCN03359.1 hypothetical protein A7X67_10735 [Clostridium sp. W14A]QNK40164.1 TRAP transporter substrate-binding protein [Caproicibacter fermentans]